MKRILFPVLAAGASLLALSAHAANDGGDIKFEGELTAQTCAVDVDGITTQPALVKLPTVSTSLLATPGSTTANRLFNINLKNCTEQSGTARAFFEYEAGVVDFADGTLMNTLAPATGVATKVALQLKDGISNAVIVAGSGTQLTTNTARNIDATGNATLPYSVQYISQLGGATAGKIESRVTYSIAYN